MDDYRALEAWIRHTWSRRPRLSCREGKHHDGPRSAGYVGGGGGAGRALRRHRGDGPLRRVEGLLYGPVRGEGELEVTRGD